MNKNKVDRIEIKEDLGIEVHFNGNIYSIQKNNSDQLVLTSITNTQLLILPKSSNCVEVKSK